MFDKDPPGVGVTDLRRKEFQKAVGGAVARRRYEGGGGGATESGELIYILRLYTII